MTQSAERESRNIVARSGFANPLTLDQFVSDEGFVNVYADDVLLDNGTDYEITGIGDPNGIEVEIIGAEDVDNYVGVLTFTVEYSPPVEQQADLGGGGAFGQAYEDAIDALTRRIQGLEARIERSLKMTPNMGGDMVMPWPPLADGVPSWNADAEAWVWGTLLGEQGPQGEQGEQGEQGAPGVDGDDGISVTAAEVVGDNLFITLSDATEIDAGNVRGPQGAQGIQGEQGEPGTPGANGTDGVMASVVAGTGIDVDATDPANPIVSFDVTEIFTASVAEINYTDGVTSPIQAQLDGKITAFADPGADRLVFWDDSAGAFAALTAGTGLTITGTTIEASGGSNDTDRRNQLLIAAATAKAMAGYLRFIDVIAIGFKAAGDADATSTVGAVNTTLGAWVSGVTTGGEIDRTAGTNIGDMTAAGGLAASFNGTISQAGSASSGSASSGGYIGKTHSSTVGSAIVYGSNDNGYVLSSNPSVTINLYGKTGSAPANATDGTLLGSVTFTDTANESGSPRTITSSDATTVFDHRWVQSTSWQRVAEVQFYTPDVNNNATLITPYQTADAARTKVRGIFEIDPLDAITLGTNWTVEYTCNGGSSWHAASTYTDCGDGQSGRTVVETDEVTCTSGTSFAARVKNLNNKRVNVHKATLKAAA